MGIAFREIVGVIRLHSLQQFAQCICKHYVLATQKLWEGSKLKALNMHLRKTLYYLPGRMGGILNAENKDVKSFSTILI